MDAVSYRRGQNQQRRSLGCACDNLREWVRFEACRIAASRSMWAPLAGRTESFARTPSIATSSQDHLPVSGQDLPRRVNNQGQDPMELPRATSWAATEMFEAAKPHPG